jgi:transcriptional regulator with GAF, ATPase, and Fis domain
MNSPNWKRVLSHTPLTNTGVGDVMRASAEVQKTTTPQHSVIVLPLFVEEQTFGILTLESPVQGL